MSKADELRAKNENLFERNTILLNENERLKKENAELKNFINAPLIKGRRTTRKEFYQTVWDLSKQLAKVKEILAKLLEEEKNNMYWEMNGSDKSSYYEVRKQAEQFLKEIEK